MPKIAISYRRTDSDSTGRIFDRLVKHYGKNSVFRDIDDVPIGLDFRKAINEALGGTDVLIAIVGPNWRGISEGGSARIGDANDLVRIEVETALERDIPVIPVLVGGTTMPTPTELPESLSGFSFRNAATIDSGRNFENDIERLMRAMDNLFKERGVDTTAQQRQVDVFRWQRPLMGKRGRAQIRSEKRLLDDFFKVDQYEVCYQLYGRGSQMSEYYSRLNFAREDGIGILLFNVDTRSVILVEQFKLPALIGRRRDDLATQNGWIVEVMAGPTTAQLDETPEQSVIRETLEETGYEIETPKLICSFFPSPSSNSERIFLYFAIVTDSRRPGGDKNPVAGDEHIRIFQLGVDDLFEKLQKGEIEDAKLVIAAYWLKDNIGHLGLNPRP